MHDDRMNIELPNKSFKESQIGMSKLWFISVPADHFHYCKNSADPDEVPLYAAFHLGLHSLPKYLFVGILNEELTSDIFCRNKIYFAEIK